MEQFIISVMKLREAQKAFSIENNKINLEAKIFWEMDVDAHIKKLKKYIAKSDISKHNLHEIFK